MDDAPLPDLEEFNKIAETFPDAPVLRSSTYFRSYFKTHSELL